eukprot:SAG11_NODE_7584_length_1125_cov_1.824561_2_plen_143_part_00
MMHLAPLALLVGVAAADADTRPWMNKADPPGARAAKLLAKMSLAEKIVMLHGPDGTFPDGSKVPCCECHNKTTGKIISPLCAYTGNVAPNKRLGIPPINMNDVRNEAPITSCRSKLLARRILQRFFVQSGPFLSVLKEEKPS